MLSFFSTIQCAPTATAPFSKTTFCQPFPPNPISDSRPQRKNQKTFATTVLVFFPVPCGSVSGRRTTHSVFVLQSRWTLCLKEKNEPSKELPKFSVKLFLHSVGMLQRNSNMTWFHMLTSSRVIISAFRRIPRASWNAKERLWMFRFLPCKKQRRF
ncbi:hypothetical protein HN51_060832 [Arachis hypogaea]|nr:uncharacterized protein LOC112734929 isoform X2 [Arachis hypogaea]